MSALAERHHDLAPFAQPERPYTAMQWHELVARSAAAAWRVTNLHVTYDTAYRIVDAALREAFPHMVPEGLR